MSPNEILCQVAQETSVRVKDMKSPKRWAALTNARRLAALRLRAIGLSYPDIGRLLGGKHHTTVLYWIKSDPQTWLSQPASACSSPPPAPTFAAISGLMLSSEPGVPTK